MIFRKKEENPELQAKKAAQDWLPFKDIAGHFIFRKDEQMVIALKIEPINIILKSEAEKKRIVAAVHEALNGIQYSIQILALPRSVDLDQYLESLQEKSRTGGDLARKRILQDYIRYVAGIVKGGDALERRYYLLISLANNKQGTAGEELLKRGYELKSNLETSGLSVSICDDAGIIDMMFSFLYPTQAVFETIPTGVGVTTIYQEGRLADENH